MRTQHRTKLLFAVLITIIGTFLYTGSSVFGQKEQGNTSLDTLNIEIEGIKNKIKDLEGQKEEYEDQITQLQRNQLSLDREINILDNRIAQKEVEIETQQARIEQTTLEIQDVEREISKAEREITNKKRQLGFVLDKLNREGDVDYFKALLIKNNFAEFFDEIKRLENIQGDVHQLVVDVQEHKVALEKQQETLEERRTFQEQLKFGLEEKRAELVEQQSAKQFLVSETRLEERRFQGLIAEIRREQQNANADIVNLEEKIRDQLARDQVLSSLGGDEEFAWPVNSRLITARFHDPSYPYRYVFEHPAIDIAVSQGTPVRATKSGYVGRAKDAGLGYSYVLIIHDDGISSVYGHLSRIDVAEDQFVVQGQVIGLSGGIPGTPGAGSFSTGAHLHFELRQDGIPINPENYLP